MTQEEKAKRYDEAIERAKERYENMPLYDLEYIFPELKESEDERIRKEILEYFQQFENEELRGVNISDWIAWLEKQGKNNMGISEATKKKLEDNLNKALEKETPESWNKFLDEQIPADKVEPKFKVGDWVIDVQGISSNQIIGYEDDSYYIETSCSKFYLPMKLAEKNYRLWTIQDAKDGDVLATSAGAFIYNGNNGGGSCPGSYCGINTLGRFKTGVKHHWTWKKVYPATQEQSDLLFSKMKEAGYVWDAEKKELKKIEQKHTPKHRVGDTIYYNSFGELKSMIVANVVTDSTDNPMYEDKEGNAVFEEDIIEQKPVWSEEDEQYLLVCKNALSKYQTTDKWDACIISLWLENKLKSLKERVQPKQEWSEEDENRINRLIAYFEDKESFTAEDDIVYANWLKSLRPQNRWKPSKEQMHYLSWIANIKLGDSVVEQEVSKHLNELLEDLKKLKD